MAQPRFKHNPSFLSDEELENQFVIRQRELSLILETIQGNTGGVNQHLLIVAPRGMGKTMLMRRVTLALRADAGLAAHWWPVVLPEENYTVATEGELWLRTLSYIQPDRDGDRWRSILETLKTERDEVRLRSQALARLKEIAQASGKRLVVMVENLNTLFEEQANSNTGWDLRKTLLNEPSLMLLATATARFDEIENAGKSMFDLFREIKLAPIPTDECITLWQAIAGETLNTTRVRPLEILTGGNPRLLTILASFAGGASFRELMKDLIVLIDDHTTYFKANVESLPPLERRIYATLAEIWSPAGAREIAQQARLDVSKTSAQLNRLVARGAVVEVARKGRKIFYQIAERLFNIYHLMRQSSAAADRAKAVVDFMVRFYDLDEVGGCIAREACTIEGEERKLHISAYNHLLCKYATNQPEKEKLLSATPTAFLEIAELKQALLGERTTSRTGTSMAMDKINDTAERESHAVRKAKDLLREALEVGKNDPQSEIARYDQMIEQFGANSDLWVMEKVAMALVNKGITLGELDRSEEEIGVYDEVIRRFAEGTETPVVEPVAMALFNKGFRLGALDRSEEAIGVYDEVVRRFAERPEVPIVDQVAMALVNKGITLGELDRSEEAIGVYDEVVRRFAERPEAPIVEKVASALASKAETLVELNRFEEAAAVYGHLQAKLHSQGELSLRRFWVIAVLEKALILLRLNRFGEAQRLMSDLYGRDDLPDEFGMLITNCLINFAAQGFEKETLNMLIRTPAETKFEPLVVALKKILGQEVMAPQEVEQVAADVIGQIQKRRDALKKLSADG
ncbi:MAG: AAA family ATPase [Pseudomonadota bacterium]